MNKIAHYLQDHLLGEVTASPDIRSYFATDNSIFSIMPSAVIYPRNENDVRKTARFSWQLAERGRVIPITARGAGTDFGGGALSEALILSFPAHMNRIVQLDAKNGIVHVEPGINYGRLQQTLHTHDRFLPPYPESLEYSTVGGAVGNNAAGKHSIKYGNTSAFVESLRVVLANGEVMTTGRLSKREINKKMGLSTFEGDIYRKIDALIEENRELIHKIAERNIARSTAAYNIADVKQKNGSMDLTPLFVGSQSTLGIITEIVLKTEVYNPETTLFLAIFDSIDAAVEAAGELRSLPDVPCSLEMVDGNLLSFVNRLNPNQLKAVLGKDTPEAVLLVEFDDISVRHRRKAVKKARTVFERLAVKYEVATAHEDKSRLWKVRHASAAVLSHTEKQLKAVPMIEDCIVPFERIGDAIKSCKALFAAEHLQVAIWGHIGEGVLHVHPFFDIGTLGDRQKAFRLLDKFYAMVLEYGGSTSSQHNDGLLRGSLLAREFGDDGYNMMVAVKKIFDPYNMLNPHVKTGATLDYAKENLRSHYTLTHLYDHMPRT